MTNIVDVTAHSISLFQENDQPKHINKIFIPQTSISNPEPIDVQIDELGNNITTMYQLIGIMHDGQMLGLESMFNFMNEHFFSKDDPAINEHHYHITKNNTKKHISYTRYIKPKHITLKITDVQMSIIAISTKANNNITNDTSKQHYI